MKKILVFLVLITFFFYGFKLFKASVNYAQTDRFVDENDHMIGGYFLLNGKKLYKDISVVHQPLNYYFSSLGQKIFDANSLYTFINRQRIMIFLYSFFWNLLYIIFFGPTLILFTFIFEITKYWFLGNLLLGETLAVYPVIFLFGILIKKLIFKKELNKLDLISTSAASFLGVFILLQMWPTIFLLNLGIFWTNRKKIYNFIYLIVPFILLTIILFIFVPLKYYIQEVFVYSFTYYLPYMAKVNTIAGYLRMIFLPLTAIHPNFNSMELIIAVFVFIYFIYGYVFWKNKKLLAFSFLIICLISTNNREDIIKMNNFHLLPWLGTYLFLPIALLPTFFKKNNFAIKELKITAFVVFIIILSIIFVNFLAKTPFNEIKNVMSENDNNFHDINKYGMAIKAIDKPGDRLISFPSDNLIHWVSQTDLATRQIEYYGWQYSIVEDKNRLIDVFKNHPAEFVVNADTKNSLPQFIRPYLDKYYVQINEQGTPSRLFILKTIIPRITQDQWATFEYLLFERPVVSISE